MSKAIERTELEERAAAEVDRIRDIIFGAQARSYDQQFKRIAAQFEQLDQQLGQLRADLERQVSELGERARAAEERLQQRCNELETSGTQQTAQTRAESRQFSDQLRTDLGKRLDQLGAELRKQGQELRSQLTAAVDALETDKASRRHVGDLLVEMGTRLKEQKEGAEEDIAGLLGHLADTP